MKATIITCLAAILLFLSSCTSDCFQYEVHAFNDTMTPIQVEYKSWVDHRRIFEDSVLIQPGERAMLISTFDYVQEFDGEGLSADHCARVADFVRAKKIETGERADSVWCTNQVDLLHTDLAQGEFHIHFADKHFE